MRAGINIHQMPSDVVNRQEVPGALTIEFHGSGDGYSDVTLFTGDAAYSTHMSKAHADYHAKLKADEINDRERDNIANGHDVDEDDSSLLGDE